MSRISSLEIVLLPNVRTFAPLCSRELRATSTDNTGRAHAGNFVGSHRRAHARAVDHDADIDRTISDCARDCNEQSRDNLRRSPSWCQNHERDDEFRQKAFEFFFIG